MHCRTARDPYLVRVEVDAPEQAHRDTNGGGSIGMGSHILALFIVAKLLQTVLYVVKNSQALYTVQDLHEHFFR
jgi:hypothetical protein